MSEHLTDDDVRLYRRKELPAGLRLAVSEHLHVCEPCRDRVFESGSTSARGIDLHGLLDEDLDHPSYEDLEGLVDGTLPPARALAVQSHLQDCAECRAESDQLRELQQELARAAQRPLEQVAPPATRGWSWFAAAAAIVLVAGGTLFFSRYAVRQDPPDGAVAVGARPDAAGGAPAGTGEAIRDGERVLSVSPGAVMGLEGIDDRYRAAVQRVLAAREVSMPDAIAALGVKPGLLLTPEGTPAADTEILSPIGTVVASGAPVFRWRGPAGAIYRVTVFGEDFAEVAASEAVSDLSWRPKTPLDPGRTYAWQLSVRHNGQERTLPVPPAPQARFRTLDEAGLQELQRIRGRAASSPLTLAIASVQLGLLEDAEAELQNLREQNPGSAVVEELIDSLQRLRAQTGASR